MSDFKDKSDEFYKWLYQELDKYEASHPNWMQLTLAYLLSDALRGLRTYIENPEVKEVSWDNPIVTLKYPVEMDFEGMQPLVKTFEAEEMRQDEDTAVEFIWLASRNFVFRALCRDAAILKQNGRQYFLYNKSKEVAPEEQYKEYQEIEDRVFEFPVSVGYDDDTGKEATVTVEFKFSALMIDQDEHEAYYPVTVSLSYDFNITEWPDEGRAHFWEMMTEILESDAISSAILEKPSQEIVQYYPAPTATERFQHILGEIEPTQVETYKPYIGPTERHYIYAGVFREPTQIQLELPGLEKDSLIELDKKVMETTDALALKVFHAVFSECYRQHHDWGAWCYWDANSFCDLLGYKRDRRGYHQTNNVAQVEKRLKALSELTYRFELLGYDPKTEADKIVFEGSLISIEPKQTVSLFKRETRIAKKSTLRIHDELYNNMMNRAMFAWYDREFLKLHPYKHRRAILLYSYYVSQLAMGARQRKGDKHIVKRPLETVMRETGIKIDYHHKSRDIESFRQAHEELKQRKLIVSYLLSDGEAKIEFHKNHKALGKHYRTRLTPEEGLVPGR